MNHADAQQVVPTGELRKLKISEIKPSITNPRQLFDPKPLEDLKASIKDHGVLVPLTVYPIKGQKNKYAILDGERRYRSCVELEKEGDRNIEIPANIVNPPDVVAGILYMFSIHGFREPWELMPTALSLKAIMDELGERETKTLSKLTGLSGIQVERCKILLNIPERFQEMSLHIDPAKRVPSNFWIEAFPVLELTEKLLPDTVKKMGREALLDRLVDKYRNPHTLERNPNFGSIINFRRIIEAFEKTEENKERFEERLRQFIEEEDAQIKDTFNDLLPTRNVKGVLNSCESLIDTLRRLESQLITENDVRVTKSLLKLRDYIEDLLEKMQGGGLMDIADTENISKENSDHAGIDESI